MKTFLPSLLACLLPLVVNANNGSSVNSAETHSLLKAAESGDVKKVTVLLDTGMPVDFQDETQDTPLIYACAAGQTEVMQLLIKRGATIDLQDAGGRTALFWATANYSYGAGAIKLLLAAGANPNITDKKGETPLGALHFYETSDIEAFLDAKVNPNLLNNKGHTPLMNATVPQWTDDTTDVLELLIKGGADLDKENKDGETALMIAEQHGSMAAIKVLKKHGAKEKPVLLQKPDSTADKDPAHAWALAADAQYAQYGCFSSQLLGYDPDDLAWKQDHWKNQILSESWGIKSREDLEKALKWLSEEGDRGTLRKKAGWTPSALPDKPGTEPSKFLAYDLVRYISRVRAGYAAGYFTEAEAWERIMPVAVRLQHAYKSWEEMGADRLEGRILGGEKSPGFEMVYKLLINHQDRNSPWNINAWNTPLEKPVGNGK